MQAVGLDPLLGIFHTDKRYRASLSLDAMEAVRPVVDAYVLAMLTQRRLSRHDFVETRHELYAAAAHVATLTIASLDREGRLTPVTVVPTRPGARNAVATEQGVAYLTDASEGKILVVAPSPQR